MKHILLLFCALALSAGIYAQGTDENEQVLVFRHSGEVNLFYASELDSIVLSCYDADSVVHDEIVSQLFYAKDTTMLVPIAEIDSVAFGSRNEMVLNSSVHELLDDIDFPWIIRTEGNTIYYRTDTPDNILPKMGDKLYYASANDFIPTGLAAKVVSVEVMNSEIAVTLEEVELTEIFDKLFYAGQIKVSEVDTEGQVLLIKKYDNDDDNDDDNDGGFKISPSLNRILDMGTAGTLDINGTLTLVGNFVVNCSILKRTIYCCANVKGNTAIGFEWALTSEDSDNFTLTSPRIAIPLPIVAGVVHPVIYTNLFIEGKAELSLKYSMERNYQFEYEWTYNNGEKKFTNKTPTGKDNQKQDKAKIEIVLSGELYAGAELGMEFNLTGDPLGLTGSLKAGPYIKGELGFGLLQDLRDYDSKVTFNDRIDMGLKLQFDLSYFTRERIFFGNRVDHPLYKHEFDMFKHSLHLFPEYAKGRAVKAETEKKSEVSVAAEVKTEIPHEVETGFEIVNQAGEIVDSVFLEKPIEANEVEAQDLSATFDLPEDIDSDKDSLLVRPVFKYSGYTISAAPIRIMHDSNIMPITSYTTNGVGMYIAGASVIGTAKIDSTVYHIGNYIPVPMSLYESNKKVGGIIEGGYMVNNSIIGTWTGKYNGEDISLTFKDDNDGLTGTYVVGDESRSFKYSLNKPQSGDVRLLFEDETAIVITIINVNDTTLKYYNKNDKTECTLNRQY